MKKLMYAALLCLLASGCRNSQYNTVVKETYIHKYGVPVAKTDWDTQGQEGKIVQLTKEGVTISRSYHNGNLQGESTFSFPNSSTIQMTEVYENGVLVAKKENYSSGVPRQEETLRNGELMQLVQWYEDGTPALTETYEHGLLISGEYRTPLNITESKVQDGKGIRIARNSEGDLLHKDTFRGGALIERITYFSNGDPAMVTPFENGMIHGTQLTYYRGGLPATIEQWVQGNQEGTTIAFQNGEKSAEVPYVHGKKHGIEMIYRDGKDLVEEVTWKNGQKHGLRKIHVDDETQQEWYHQGELVSHATYERLNMTR